MAGQFLSDAQQKLRDQVMALSARIESRDLSAATEEFTGFNKDMQDAAAAMAPSADKLKATQWKDALPLEQKALQALLRAEATFRKIQVAFGQSGGGAGGGSAGRDLASLFDLELDTEKNQYETAQNVSPQEQHAKDVEDALAKLDALAKRAGRASKSAAQSAAKLRAALAAGNAAARSRATAAADARRWRRTSSKVIRGRAHPLARRRRRPILSRVRLPEAIRKLSLVRKIRPVSNLRIAPISACNRPCGAFRKRPMP